MKILGTFLMLLGLIGSLSSPLMQEVRLLGLASDYSNKIPNTEPLTKEEVYRLFWDFAKEARDQPWWSFVPPFIMLAGFVTYNGKSLRQLMERHSDSGSNAK